MSNLTTEQFKSVINDFVRLSNLSICPSCGNETKFVGETTANGNWICAHCLSYFPIKLNEQIEVSVPFIKLTNQLDTTVPKGILLGDPPSATFPMNLSTGFLVPSYSYKIKRKRNVLLAVMDDFSRTGRVKSGNIWQFDLVWNERTREEYEELISFSTLQAYHNAFNYHDVWRDTDHICFFDSDVSDAEPTSFDNVNFSVRITE